MLIWVCLEIYSAKEFDIGVIKSVIIAERNSLQGRGKEELYYHT